MGKSLGRAELDLMMRSVANVVQAYIRAAAEPLIQRIALLEAREPLRGEKGDPGRDGKDGYDGNPGTEGAPGRDGVDGKDGLDGAHGERGEQGREGPAGRDGRDGQPGSVGKDGLNGKDGRDGIDGKDGAAGLNGKDGFSLEDFSASLDDGGRVLILRFASGERSKEFRLVTDTVLDRGVFKDGQTYERGDMVTWGGSGWVCQKETAIKPGDGSADWRLFVKKGRDGKDGNNGKDGERGAPGRDGRNAY